MKLRLFVSAGLFASILCDAASLLGPDYRRLISRADLTYTSPANRSEEGLPLGNGRMGTLVWTTPGAIRFQLNRADVFPINGETHSFPERHSDYLGGCGYVDVNFVSYGDDVFAGKPFSQHLSLYDGLMALNGRDVTMRLFVSAHRDVLALEVDDHRRQPSAISIDLRMLRYVSEYFAGRNYQLATNHTVLVQTRNHFAGSTLGIHDYAITLTQDFHEGDYFDTSAVAIRIIGRKSQARYLNESTVQLSAAPAKGKFLIIIGTAATFNPKQDVAEMALKALEEAAPPNATETKVFAQLLAEHTAWWHDFWMRGFVHLHSRDGEADFIEQNYNYFLYLMASTSRGSFPPRFGGMLFMTTGDMIEWGSQFWWANMGCYYDGLLPANRPELLEPVFNMYSKQFEASARAARQQWGSSGIFIPETGYFDGLENLPEDVAAEMRELYLGRKPWNQRSTNFMRFAETKNPHNSRWNWMDKTAWVDLHLDVHDRGAGPRGPVVTIFSSGAKIAHLYWQAYQCSLDKGFLRDWAYPMLKGVAEFYRTYPNLRKGDDGKYHIRDVNNHEPVWGATDSQEEIAAIRGILPVAIRASETLGVDAEFRTVWRDLLENLAPLPTNESGQWVGARPPVVHGEPDRPGFVPLSYYDLCAVGTEDERMRATADATFDLHSTRHFETNTPVSVLNQVATVAAHLGRGEDLKHILPNQIRCLAPDHDFCDWRGSGEAGVMRNRLTLREGPGAIDAERLGRITRGLHEGLMQSIPPAPGEDPLLIVFPAWPKDWDANFTLLARGAFVVSSSIEAGKLGFVEILSKAGAECHLRNPWKTSEVVLSRNGKTAEKLSGNLLKFPTSKGETVVLVPAGAKPSARNVR
ncbi:MAG TPA: DUF5703 domain-containing protein [Candidatus Dormibacteraeota bacterium]|nr:DUF5703 domain-containing protein [Candidatus Dormibacteraeota bacterium]